MDSDTLNLPAEVLARLRPPFPRCAKLQRDHDDWEWSLVDLARTHHPRIVWWWGTRGARGKSGAYCYVCGDYVATWALSFPITDKAKNQLAAHRDWHKSRINRGNNA